MCFGDKKTEETTKTTTIDPRLTQASLDNIKRLEGKANAGYQAYGGDRVAELTDQTKTGSSMIESLAGTPNPNAGLTNDLYTDYATSGPQRVTTGRSIDDVPGMDGTGGSTQDYMDPYLKSVLEPLLMQIDEETALRQNNNSREATMAGAFGDTGFAFGKAREADLGLRTKLGTVADTYSKAYTDAMARKNTDINRNLDVQKTNAGFEETALERALRGGTALQEADRYNTGRTIDIARENQRSGQLQQQVDQGKLDAAYQEYAKGNIDEATMLQILNQAINGSPVAGNTTSTQTTTKPDNSGYALLGTLAGTAANVFLPGSGTLMTAATNKLMPMTNAD